MPVRSNFLVATFLSALLFFVLPQTTCCQSSSGKIKLSHIDASNGLSNSNVTCILQDSKGFMWIGTRDGLNKYDGYEFTTYRKLPDDTTGMLNNLIRSIFEDSQGAFWVSTEIGGFYYYDRLKDHFTLVPELSAKGEIFSITEDSSHTLWVTGIMKGQGFVANLNRASNTWEQHYLLQLNGSVHSITQDTQDEYWITAHKIGLFKWNRRTNELKEVHEEGLDKSFYKVIQDENKNLWFATRNGLSKLNPKTNVFKHFSANLENPNSLPVNVVNTLCNDGRYIWIALQNGGLHKIETRTDSIIHFILDTNDPNSKSLNAVWSIYKDHQGRMWIGTFSNGLFVYDKMKNNFSELNIALHDDIVNAILKDSKNRLWIGTESGLKMLEGNKVKHYTNLSEHRRTSSNDPIFSVLSIFEDSKNRLWFGTWRGGLSRYDEQHDSFINYQPVLNNPSSLSNSNVYSIKEDRASHHILVSTYNGLNVLVDEQLGKFEKYIDSVQLANNSLRTIFEDHRGILWVGSLAALNRYDLKQHTRTTYLFHERSFDRTMVNCIAEDSEGTLWIGTDKGLHQMKNDVIAKSFTTSNGLPNDGVNGILLDDNGNLWLSTTHGISKFNPHTEGFTNYDITDGLISNEFMPNACFKSNDGQFLFGGKGVITFYPDSIKANPYIPPVFLTGLKIFNKTVDIGAKDGVLDQHISETHEITLKPEVDFFTIEYVGLNFTSSNKNQYAYKLEGFDKEWINNGTQRFATFTNLDPGTYVFRVKACNNEGLWNEVGTSLIIYILPPWWKTWWFKTFLAFGLLGIAVLISIIHTRNVRRINRILEKTVDEKTIELVQNKEEISAQRDLLSKQKENLEAEVAKRTQELVEYNHQLEQFAFISAHNLRAPVATILGLGEVLRLNPEDTIDKKSVFEKVIFATRELDRVVRDLNTILEIRKNNVSVISEINLAEELALVLIHIEKEIKETSCEIKSDFSKAPVINSVKPYVESILLNLLSNAIKYRHPERKPLINITSEFCDNYIRLTITDNGLGIETELHKDKIFGLYQRFHSHVEGKGLGLHLVKTQITALGGKIEIESKVNQGTTFLIYFKIAPE